MTYDKKDFISTQDLTREQIDYILNQAMSFREINQREVKKIPTLKGRTIGKWDGEKIHDYIDELNEKIKQDIERRNWAKTKRLKWHFKWNYNNIIMYSQPGSHALMIIFLCIQVGAIACGIVYFVIAAKQHYENDEGSYVYQ